MFEQYKTNALKDYNNAKLNNLADKDILKELDGFNELADYYTTSSCSGRILLLRLNKKREKMPKAFYYKTHSKASELEVLKQVKNYDDKFDLWFKLEPFIIHIGCRDIEAARKLLDYTKQLGIKRAGINAFSNRIIVEVIGTQTIDAPIIVDGRILVDTKYLKILTIEANKKMAKNKRVLHSFFKGSKVLNR